MTEAAVIAELRDAAERQRVSAEAMRYLADAARRAQRLVFRELARRAATDLPMYEVGYAEDPARFSPHLEQLDAVAHLHLIVRHRGSWVPVRLGREGYARRGEIAMRELGKAIAALGTAAPALADELRRIERRRRRAGDSVPMMRLPWRTDSPSIQV